MIEPRLRFKADDGSDFPDWEEKKIASLGDMVGGGTPTTKKKEYWHGKTAWISSADVEENDIYNINMTRFITQEAIDNSATKIIPKNSILIVSRVGVGKVAKAPCDLCTSQDFTNIVDVKGDSTFLTYAVLRLMQSKLQCVQGTSIKGIPSDEIRNYIMNVPSLPEQQKIADFLSTIDTVIEKQQATVSAWEERKKGVMQKLFSQEVRFKADDGSDFPELEAKSLFDICEYKNKQSVGKNYVGTENMKQNFSGLESLDEETEMKGVCYCKGDTLMSNIRPYLRKTWKADREGVCSTDVLVFHPIDVVSEYLHYLIASDKFISYVMTGVKGVKMPRGDKEHMMKFSIMVPSLPEQQKIADCLSALDAVIEKQKETLEKWQELKKGLLQQMFV